MSIFSIGLLGLAGCASTPTTPVQIGGSADSGADSEAVEAVLEAAYLLGAGDQLRIIIFGEADLSGEFVIDGSGRVSLPLVGEVDAAGKTLVEFRRDVEAALSDGYLNDPRVSAEVLNYRPFYIMGEVQESGEYPYSDGLTVTNAVARAGGYTYRANTRVVYIKRAGADIEVVVPLTPGIRVMPGDTIRIAERFF